MKGVSGGVYPAIIIMEKLAILNSKAVKKVINSSFVAIGIFTVLSYCFAAIVLLYGGENLGNNIFIIILLSVLVAVPILLFFKQLCFMRRCYKKLNETSNNKTNEACAICELKREAEARQKQYEIILDMLSRMNRIGCCCPKNKILWIGSKSNVFCCNVEAFESHGIKINVVSDINEALNVLKTDTNYIAIIYAIGRNDNNKERDEFRENMKTNNINIPFFETV